MKFDFHPHYLVEPNPHGSTNKQRNGIVTQHCTAYVELAVVESIIDFQPGGPLVIDSNKSVFALAVQRNGK